MSRQSILRGWASGYVLPVVELDSELLAPLEVIEEAFVRGFALCPDGKWG